MALVPITFPQPPESRIATYTFTEITSNTGFVKFYFGAVAERATQTTTTTNYILSSNTWMSSEQEDANTGNAPLGEELIITDKDFDLVQFNVPVILEGAALFSMPFRFQNGSASATGYLKVIIKKWDGSTETTLATGNGEPLSANDERKQIVQTIDIPRTHFKIGEILRVTVQIPIEGVGAGSNSVVGTIAYDPINRDTPSFTPSTNEDIRTDSHIFIPFRADI